jgi:Calponin homology (CH) domain
MVGEVVCVCVCVCERATHNTRPHSPEDTSTLVVSLLSHPLLCLPIVGSASLAGITDSDEQLQLLRAIDKLRMLASVNQLGENDSDASPASSPAALRHKERSMDANKDGKESTGPGARLRFTRSRSRTTISKTPRALRRLRRLGKATSRKKLEPRLRTWLSEMLPEYEPQLNDPKNTNIATQLSDGRVLCDLVNRMLPGTIDIISSSDKPFKQVQNIGRYLSLCRKVGIASKYQFAPAELQQGDNINAVLENINQLRLLYESGGALSLRQTMEENRTAAYVASCDDDLVQRKAQKYDATLEKEITSWIFEKLGQPLPSSASHSFHELFRNGVYLCK